MLPKNQRGSILIPLILLLALSFGVLLTTKFFSSSQANVETAIDSRYQLTPSQHMDPPDKWISESNTSYEFELSYPKQWVASVSPKSKDTELVLEKSLSNKIKLRLTVSKSYDIPSTARQAKFDKNSYFILKEEENNKSAIMKTDKLYYLIELSHINYFPTNAEFTGTFFQLLKKFKYTGD